MQSAPGPPLPSFGQGGPVRDWDNEQAAYDRLLNRPARSINLPAASSFGQITAEQCLLLGFSFRETTGLAGAEIEIIDGAGQGGAPVAEINILAPPTAIVGQIDTDVDATASGVAAACQATLPAVAGQTTFITGFEVTGLGATAATTVNVTVQNVLGGTKSYVVAVPAGVTSQITPLIVEFSRPIPANAVNTTVAVNVPSFGAGNTQVFATAHGFQRLLAPAGVNVGQEATRNMPGGGILLRSGLFVRVIAGSVVGAVWVKL